jgi:uncharacterized coiled-coil DUF342 family protein
MEEAEKKKIRAEIAEKNKELAVLKAQVSELNSKKEAWFEKKRQATKEVSELFRSIRDAKGKRNTFTKQVKDSKQRREELNKLLLKKRQEMKRLQNEKREITKKSGIRVDPSKIKSEIEDLDLKIETEALPFHVEQKVMKRINELKKTLEQSKEVSDVFDKIHELGKELDRIRLKADEAHKKIQTKAESSQQFHEELIESSKDVKEGRQKEEDALKKFVEFKTQYNELNDKIKAKLAEISALRSKVEGYDLEEKKKVKKAEEKQIQDKKRTVEEKIQKGMKLTTEDLLAFQAKEQGGSGNKQGTAKKKPAKPAKKKEEVKEKKEEQPKETTEKPEEQQEE